MVPLRFLQCWNGYDRGAEVSFPHPGLAEELVRQRVAEVIKKAKPPAVSPAPAPRTDAGGTSPASASVPKKKAR